MTTTADDLPDDIAALQAALIVERERAARVEAELAVAKAKASDDQALIAHQRKPAESAHSNCGVSRRMSVHDASTKHEAFMPSALPMVRRTRNGRLMFGTGGAIRRGSDHQRRETR